MRLIFYPAAWDEYLEWQANDRKGLKRLIDSLKKYVALPTRASASPKR